jgi:hypothetical protein
VRRVIFFLLWLSLVFYSAYAYDIPPQKPEFVIKKANMLFIGHIVKRYVKKGIEIKGTKQRADIFAIDLEVKACLIGGGCKKSEISICYHFREENNDPFDPLEEEFKIGQDYLISLGKNVPDFSLDSKFYDGTRASFFLIQGGYFSKTPELVLRDVYHGGSTKISRKKFNRLVEKRRETLKSAVKN